MGVSCTGETLIRALFIGLFWSTALLAQSGGNSVFTFLDRSVFAGASALGNAAYLHQGKVAAFAVQNPLLLTDSSRHQLEMSSGALGQGIQLLQGSYSFDLKGRHVIVGAQTIQYGAFGGTDQWGNSQGTFYAGDIAFSIGAEVVRFGPVRIGASAKLVNGTYESYQSWAVATDAVAMYEGASGPKVALMVKNLGTQLTTFGGTYEPLPTNVLIAVGDKLAHAPFRWTFVFDQLQRPNLGYDDPNLVTVDPVTGATTQLDMSLLNLAMRHVSGSLEFTPTQRLHLMLGYNFRRQFEMSLPDRRTSGGFTLGAGLYFNKFQLHFANELRSVAGRMNTLSLGLNL
jgi:hypothetical protein